MAEGRRNAIWYLSLLSTVYVMAGTTVATAAVGVGIYYAARGQFDQSGYVFAGAAAAILWCLFGLAGLVLCRIARAVERIAEPP